MKKLKKLPNILLVLAIMLVLSSSGHAFKDVSGHWAHAPINWAKDVKLVQGYEDGSFKPDESISQAEYYALIARFKGLETKERPKFTDVKEGIWYYDDLSRLIGHGLIENKEEKLEPNRPIDRDQAARLLWAVLDQEEKPTSGLDFKDMDQIASKDAVAGLSSLAIIEGYPDGTFRPDGPLTRAEVSKIFMLASKLEDGDISQGGITKAEGENKEVLQDTIDKSKVFSNNKEGWLASVNSLKNQLDQDPHAEGEILVEGKVDINEFVNFAHDEFLKNDYDYYPYYYSHKAVRNYRSGKSYISVEYNLHPIEDYPRVREVVTTWTRENISTSDSQEEKVKKIHDFVVSANDYNVGSSYLEYDSMAGGYSVYTPEAILFGEGGVCEAYAKLFDIMAKEAGLETAYVFGKTLEDGTLHVWNKVKIDDKWYNIDTTFDDPTILDNTYISSILSYEYYLKSDQTFKNSRTFAEDAIHPEAHEDYDQSHKTLVTWKDGIEVYSLDDSTKSPAYITNLINEKFRQGSTTIGLDGGFTNQESKDLNLYFRDNLNYSFNIRYYEDIDGPLIIQKR